MDYFLGIDASTGDARRRLRGHRERHEPPGHRHDRRDEQRLAPRRRGLRHDDRHLAASTSTARSTARSPWAATSRPESTSIQHAAIGSALTSNGTRRRLLRRARRRGPHLERRPQRRPQIQASRGLRSSRSGTGLIGRYGLNEGAGATAGSSVAGAPSGTLVGRRDVDGRRAARRRRQRNARADDRAHRAGRRRHGHAHLGHAVGDGAPTPTRASLTVTLLRSRRAERPLHPDRDATPASPRARADDGLVAARDGHALRVVRHRERRLDDHDERDPHVQHRCRRRSRDRRRGRHRRLHEQRRRGHRRARHGHRRQRLHGRRQRLHERHGRGVRELLRPDAGAAPRRPARGRRPATTTGTPATSTATSATTARRPAAPPTSPYYSYNVGPFWHVVVLDSDCGLVAGGCTAGSPQVQWLVNDLAANSVAQRHRDVAPPALQLGRPRTSPTCSRSSMRCTRRTPTSSLVGHDHIYERFAPLGPTGAPIANGMRYITVGTGGSSHHSIGTDQDRQRGPQRLDLRRAAARAAPDELRLGLPARSPASASRTPAARRSSARTRRRARPSR